LLHNFCNTLQTAEIKELHQKVCERLNVEVDKTILYFGTEILQAKRDDTEMTLEDYDIATNSNITMVHRVLGGEANISFRSEGSDGLQCDTRIIHSSVRLSKKKCFFGCR